MIVMSKIFGVVSLYFLLSVVFIHICSGFQCARLNDVDVSPEQVLQVHIIPHSHLDPGWQTTFEGYYKGEATTMAFACVKCIINNVTKELESKSDRKFAFSEISFFKYWWDEQTDDKKEKVKRMVDEGRLYFVNGGWVVNDEAVSHYSSILEQYTIGMDFIRTHFGKKARPHVAWQIDPFGHSHGFASLAHKIGFDGMVLNRIPKNDKRERIMDKRMEMIWKITSEAYKDDYMFATTLFDHYAMPRQFCFDIRCDEMMDWEIKDYRETSASEVEDDVKFFIELICGQATGFLTNHIMLLMGDDFHYKDAGRIFENLEIIMKKSKEIKRANIFYSTPYEYLRAINKANVTWPVKEGDFYPYFDDSRTVWTGYFTTRPYLKRILRYTEGLLQGCKQLYAFVESVNSLPHSPKKLQESVSLMQHHDAVTGTATDNTAQDYLDRLEEGGSNCMEMLGQILKPDLKVDVKYMKLCSVVQMGSYNCRANNANIPAYLTVYNPLSWAIRTIVPVAVLDPLLMIKSMNTGQDPPLQQYSRDTFAGSGVHRIYTEITLPALGYMRFLIDKKHDKERKEENTEYGCKIMTNDDKILIVGNGKLTLTFSTKTGYLEKVENVLEKKETHLSQGYYGFDDQGGAYIFAPNCTAKEIIDKNVTISLKSRGNLMIEVYQIFSRDVKQIIRLFKDKDYFEVDYEILPQLFDKYFNVSSVSVRFLTNLKNEKLFYTDANGREIMERNATATSAERAYFPVPTQLGIRDIKRDTSLVLLPDRSHGGSSLCPGCAELMIYRMSDRDDQKGLGQGLKEAYDNATFLKGRGKIKVLFGSINTTLFRSRLLAEELLKEPFYLVHSFEGEANFSTEDTKSQNSMLGIKLPKSVQLLTVERRKSDIMIRLEHIFESADSEQPVKVPLKNIFYDISVTSAEELVITGDANINEVNPLEWNTPKDEKHKSVPPHDIGMCSFQFDVHTIPKDSSINITNSLEDCVYFKTERKYAKKATRKRYIEGWKKDGRDGNDDD